MKNDPFAIISVCLIRKVWHGKFGDAFKRKNHILCRFYPSCSNYAILALEKYGFIKGWLKSADRVRRCNPRNCESCIDYP